VAALLLGEHRARARTPGATISKVGPGSPAAQAGLAAGDLVTRIDGAPVGDFLDFYLSSFGRRHLLGVIRRGEGREITLVRAKGGDTGLEIATGGFKVCGNKCVFCFVDQLPRGLRAALYLKDEDYRLSFLHGNYLTLTNLRAEDEARVIVARLSPLYVSVHSTDEGARARLLGRKPREPILKVLSRLGRKGIRFHAQIVVVPGYNDGAVLDRTLADLRALEAFVLSVSIVPVGLTSHRRGLPAVRPVSADAAAAIAGQVAALNASLRKKIGRGVFYVSDEMMILGGRAFPAASYYDDFPQIENGVGLVRQLIDQIKHLRVPAALRGRKVTLVTGRLAEPFLEQVARRLKRAGVAATVTAIDNSLLGPSVTVSGLLPGRAVVKALRNLPRPDVVVLPPDMLNCDMLTLDGVPLSRMSDRLNTPVVLGDHSLRETLAAIATVLRGE
jgi:putative radical SAM enzyme (TIGR03279 family)